MNVFVKENLRTIYFELKDTKDIEVSNYYSNFKRNVPFISLLKFFQLFEIIS